MVTVSWFVAGFLLFLVVRSRRLLNSLTKILTMKTRTRTTISVEMDVIRIVASVAR